MEIERLGWMTGKWACSIWGGTFEESWSLPNGGTMIGVGRHIRGGDTVFMEFMSIEPDEDGLTMWMLLGAPSKGEKHPHAFRLTALSDDEALFENPSNPYPSKIRYQPREGGLWCRIEGTEDGRMKFDDFEFRPL